MASIKVSSNWRNQIDEVTTNSCLDFWWNLNVVKFIIENRVGKRYHSGSSWKNKNSCSFPRLLLDSIVRISWPGPLRPDPGSCVSIDENICNFIWVIVKRNGDRNHINRIGFGNLPGQVYFLLETCLALKNEGTALSNKKDMFRFSVNWFQGFEWSTENHKMTLLVYFRNLWASVSFVEGSLIIITGTIPTYFSYPIDLWCFFNTLVHRDKLFLE